jgi:hypothetical protein
MSVKRVSRQLVALAALGSALVAIALWLAGGPFSPLALGVSGTDIIDTVAGRGAAGFPGGFSATAARRRRQT